VKLIVKISTSGEFDLPLVNKQEFHSPVQIPEQTTTGPGTTSALQLSMNE